MCDKDFFNIFQFLNSKLIFPGFFFIPDRMYMHSQPHSYGRSRLERDRSEYDEYGDRREMMYHHPHYRQHEHSHHMPHSHHGHHSGVLLREQYAARASGSSEERYYPGDDRYLPEERYHGEERYHRRDDDYHSPHHAPSRRALNAI